MLIDEFEVRRYPDPKDPWWMVWGDVLVFAIACVACTFLLLNWMWRA